MRARAAGLTLLAAALLAGGACSNAPLSSQGPAPAVRAAAPEPPPAVSVTLPKSPLSEDQQITDALNRLGYGPRPGDVERVCPAFVWSPALRIPLRLQDQRFLEELAERHSGVFDQLARQ